MRFISVCECLGLLTRNIYYLSHTSSDHLVKFLVWDDCAQSNKQCRGKFSGNMQMYHTRNTYLWIIMTVIIQCKNTIFPALFTCNYSLWIPLYQRFSTVTNQPKHMFIVERISGQLLNATCKFSTKIFFFWSDFFCIVSTIV